MNIYFQSVWPTREHMNSKPSDDRILKRGQNNIMLQYFIFQYYSNIIMISERCHIHTYIYIMPIKSELNWCRAIIIIANILILYYLYTLCFFRMYHTYIYLYVWSIDFPLHTHIFIYTYVSRKRHSKYYFIAFCQE